MDQSFTEVRIITDHELHSLGEKHGHDARTDQCRGQEQSEHDFYRARFVPQPRRSVHDTSINEDSIFELLADKGAAR